ncbi:MAG: hypothetical protein JNG88_18140 [Phycisphaerales bacterium]|nr:hypothetical protein [Phycisphaerales bacterium]
MPEWVHLLTGKDVASNGAFTGDGRYFLVNANNAKCVIVIDTATGVERQRLDFAADPMYPLEGSRALTSSGQIIDAEAGRLVDYVNKTAWWRKAGLKIGE